ncbi:MAG: FAD:protein FMN transferase [Bacteroidales bacterium]|nr:FAD:protein FMN transferase [Bacteroidales bacterium]
MKKITVLAALLLLLCQCDRDRYIAIGGYAQGGTYTVKLNMKGVREEPRRIQQHIDSLLTDIDNSLSGYNQGSLLSRFNRGENVRWNDTFRDVYALSRSLWEETGGALDVAAAPLFDAWGFGFSRDSLPDDATVRNLLTFNGMRHLPAAADSLVADGRHKLNFNAIAQGYSCDVVARYLYSLGVRDMLVDIGEIYCDGLNPSGKPWSIAVDTPIDGNQELGASTSATWHSNGGPQGVVTSGNYRKFYIRDGRKYAHTIDPRTGYPVTHSLLSATVIAPSAAIADAYATVCMVLGLQEARALLTEKADLEGLLIYEEDGQMCTWASPGFNNENR